MGAIKYQDIQTYIPMRIPYIKTEVNGQINNKEKMALAMLEPTGAKAPIFDGSTHYVIY